MRKFLLGSCFAAAMAMTAMGAEWSGYITDAACAGKQGAKAAADTHAGCAKGCIKKGEKAVLLTPDGKIFNITNQDKVVEHAGEKVTVTGDLDGDNITVSDIKS